MPIGYHRSSKPQVWNGAGMTLLSKEERSVIGKRQAKKSKVQRNGWPASVQREGEDNKHTYRLADLEWARLMAASKSR